MLCSFLLRLLIYLPIKLDSRGTNQVKRIQGSASLSLSASHHGLVNYGCRSAHVVLHIVAVHLSIGSGPATIPASRRGQVEDLAAGFCVGVLLLLVMSAIRIQGSGIRDT